MPRTNKYNYSYHKKNCEIRYYIKKYYDIREIVAVHEINTGKYLKMMAKRKIKSNTLN